jgi:23S rRNA (cytidine1920-2'-O)/16S rRNA (cytidine1409-2'-O)-methyltransferase
MRVQMRIDRALVDRGLVRSRTEAQELIASRQVRLDGLIVVKASTPVSADASLGIEGNLCPYVSRGGFKLAAALRSFSIDPGGKCCLDAGASTGGFTDCLLQHGAAHVTAVDVGHGQMAAAIANNARVTNHEGVNIRNLAPSDFSFPFDIIVADLAFISLTLVIEQLASVLSANGDMILLVKPQFEVGRDGIGKGGIVKDVVGRAAAVERIAAAGVSCGLTERGRMESPITGGDGNVEYLLWLRHVTH